MTKTSITHANINSEGQHHQLSSIILHTADSPSTTMTSTQGYRLFVHLQHTYLNALHFGPQIISLKKINKHTPLLSQVKGRLLILGHLETRAHRKTIDERFGRDLKTTQQRWPDLKLESPLVTHTVRM